MTIAPPSITPGLQPGIHYGLKEELYHADPSADVSLSCSLAKVMLDESPRHAYYRHPRLGMAEMAALEGGEKEESNAAMDFGTLCHKLLLGHGPEVEVGPWKDWRKDEAKAFAVAVRARGHIPTLPHVMKRAQALELVVRNEIDRQGFGDDFRAAQSEVAVIWKRETATLRCKFDKLLLLDDPAAPIEARCFDLKIGGMANPLGLERHIAAMNYDLQDVMYTDGLPAIFPALAGRIQWTFFFIEDSFPFSVVHKRLSGEFRELGNAKYQTALHLWQRSLDTGYWAGWADASGHVYPNSWDVTRTMERALGPYVPVAKPAAVAQDVEAPFA